MSRSGIWRAGHPAPLSINARSPTWAGEPAHLPALKFHPLLHQSRNRTQRNHLLWLALPPKLQNLPLSLSMRSRNMMFPPLVLTQIWTVILQNKKINNSPKTEPRKFEIKSNPAAAERIAQAGKASPLLKVMTSPLRKRNSLEDVNKEEAIYENEGFRFSSDDFARGCDSDTPRSLTLGRKPFGSSSGGGKPLRKVTPDLSRSHSLGRPERHSPKSSSDESGRNPKREPVMRKDVEIRVGQSPLARPKPVVRPKPLLTKSEPQSPERMDISSLRRQLRPTEVFGKARSVQYVAVKIPRLLPLCPLRIPSPQEAPPISPASIPKVAVVGNPTMKVCSTGPQMPTNGPRVRGQLPSWCGGWGTREAGKWMVVCPLGAMMRDGHLLSTWRKSSIPKTSVYKNPVMALLLILVAPTSPTASRKMSSVFKPLTT